MSNWLFQCLTKIPIPINAKVLNVKALRSGDARKVHKLTITNFEEASTSVYTFLN